MEDDRGRNKLSWHHCGDIVVYCTEGTCDPNHVYYSPIFLVPISLFTDPLSQYYFSRHVYQFYVIILLPMLILTYLNNVFQIPV